MIKTEILKKTEKIDSAIYLITGFFDDKEPLKWKLRTLGSELVSKSISLKDNPSITNDKATADINNLMLEIDSLFLVAKRAGLVSDMNHEILSQEFNKFTSSIVDAPKLLGQSNHGPLSRDFFGSSVSIHTHTEKNTEEIIKDKTENKEVKDESDKGQSLENVNPVHPKTKNPPKHLKDFSVVAVKKNSRQSTIINLLKRKREIMIKDVSPLIEGCSEKTIQRELMTMVHDGTLRKIGEKRWSRYSLART